MKLKAYLSLIRFDKPVGTLLLLWPTLDALFIASNGSPPLIVTLVFVLGVFLTRAAGCAINDFADSNFDKRVKRTKNRPVANGIISKIEAMLISIFLSLCAFGLAYQFLKIDTLWMSVPALILFMVYPFTKRFFAYPQFILGIAFSFGILMAFIEIVGHITNAGWLLFFANLFWVFGYDTIYAMVDKVDDLKIGIKTSAISLGDLVIKAVTISYSLFIVLMIAVGIFHNFHDLYWVTIIIAASLLGVQIKVLIERRESSYFNMFLLNNWIGAILFIGIVFSLHLGSYEITSF